MNDELKSFYHFEGCWFDVFDMLVGIIKPKNAQRFSVWESRKEPNSHLLIVYGPRLATEWEQQYNVRVIAEPEFQRNYKCKMEEHIIHGYNEFKRRKPFSR